MMKSLIKFLLTVSCFGIFSLVQLNCASAAEPPSDKPPTMDNLDEGIDPAVTHSKKATTGQVTQTIQNGEQTEVKVTNGIGTYIVKPNQSVGGSLPGDAQSSSNHAAQWVIKSWGGSKNTEPNPDEAPPTLAPNPNESHNK